jgi:hypothetical protein
LWQFLRLDGVVVTLETREYTLGELGIILAFIHRFVAEANATKEK